MYKSQESYLIRLVFFFLTLLSTPILHATESIEFKNFNQKIKLIKKGEFYHLENSELKVTLSNDLIVKTSKKLGKKGIKNLHKNIVNVKQLYTGSKFNYYSASLKQGTITSKLIKKINRKKGVKLVQPDVLQIKNKAHENHVKKQTGKHAKSRKLRKSTRLAKILPRYLKFIGVKELWKTHKGKGVKVAIIDDGVELQHPDLKHVKQVFSYDAQTQTLLSSPQLNIDTHGTEIAGVIFAAHDNKGIDGIAPEAEIIAIRQPDTWTSKTILSFQLAQLSGADIINCSWNSQWLMQPIKDIIDDLSINGRGGKGTAVVIAAGNDAKEILANSTEASIQSAIVVAASTYFSNRKLKFSNFGQSIDLSVFGRKVSTTILNGKYGEFSGTSLSAAIVSGTSALLLSQNPDLSLSELQNALIKMTRKIKKNKKNKNNSKRKNMRKKNKNDVLGLPVKQS